MDALEVKWTAEKIKSLRDRHKMTQMKFAEIVGCRPQTVSEWEIGRYVPKNAYVKVLDMVELQLERTGNA